MRILHVWDQAGVNCLMALYQRRMGYQADVVMRQEFDSHCSYYGFTEKLFCARTVPLKRFPKWVYQVFPMALRVFLKKARRKLLTVKFYMDVVKLSRGYDILHVNSVWLVCLLLPWKPKILEMHGDDMRGSPSFAGPVKKFLTRCFLSVYTRFSPLYVSTSDLLAEGFRNVVWVPNPVDVEHFGKRDSFVSSSALYCRMWYEDSARAEGIAALNGWALTVHDRKENAWVPYEEMPSFLAPFEYYIDRYGIRSLSKTALEALAMGLKVVRYDGVIVEGLPSEHLPENVAENTLSIYRSVLS